MSEMQFIFGVVFEIKMQGRGWRPGLEVTRMSVNIQEGRPAQV